MIEETDEDVHSAIERLLGPVGRKIHAGRSRNDQVVTAFRLWTLERVRRGNGGDRGARARRARPRRRGSGDADARLHASPARAAGHARPPPARLGRDARPRSRPVRARGLACGAVAARARARSPGRRCRCPKVRNSLDAVADRDFALDYLYACAALFVHLSRIGEELALWATAEFGFVRLPESAATGSSMMPQKLNPDVAELARGKAGTAIGRLTGLLATVKGLPLVVQLRPRRGQAGRVRGAARRPPRAGGAGRARPRPRGSCEERLEAAASDPGLLATDAAEALVAEGVPVPRRPRAGRARGPRRCFRPPGRRRRRALPRGSATCGRRSPPRRRRFS